MYVQCTGLPFQFVFFRKHFRHRACTQFPKLKFIRHNFVKKWPWNLREMQGKWRNGESSVLSNLLFNCTHQIFVHHRRTAAPQIIMHIFASFIKQLHPSPYHWTTHGMFSVPLNYSWHVLCTTELLMACSLYHWTTHGMFSVPLNYSWHVLHTRHKVKDKFQLVSCSSHSWNGLHTAFHMRRGSLFS